MKKKTIAFVGTAVLALGTLAALRVENSRKSGDAPLLQDDFGRFTTEVFVNGEGPFQFLVDTGAAMSCVSPGLAERFKLSRIAALKVNVQGTSGTEGGSMYLATSYKSGVFAKTLEPLVGLISTTAVKDGVVGMNAFSGGRVEMNFAERRLKVGASAMVPATFAAIPAEMKGTDAVVDVEIDGVAAQAIIDTGARRTIANTALRDRLGLKADDPRLSDTESSQGATEQHLPASGATFHSLRLGSAQFESPRITFSELDLFARRGLQQTPAMLLGMDLLGKLKAIAIDYPRAEVQLKP